MNTMTPERMRAKIAEVCGWEVWEGVENRPSLAKPRDKKQRDYWISCGCSVVNKPNERVTGIIPDYLNDLNAMHDAEPVLGTKQSLQWHRYVDWLINLCADSANTPIDASADQRAEAFLRTLNLWENSP